MTAFLWNILLAIVWAAANEDFSPMNLVVGFGLGYGILWFLESMMDTGPYSRRFRKTVAFLFFFIGELVRANLRMAWQVLHPRAISPGIIAIPLRVKHPAAITLLANVISLVPGSLSVEVSADHSTLYIHEMDADDPDEVRHRIASTFEARILELME